MTKHTEAAPQLPPASVDFNALHDAMIAGTDGSAAVKKAVFAETLMRTGDDADRIPAADEGTDGLDDLTKAQLQDRARELGVGFESDANKDRLKELIRAHPAAFTLPASDAA